MSTEIPSQSPPRGPEHREHARRAVLMAGRLQCCGAWADCEVVNISAGGARLRVREAYSQGQELCLEIGSCGPFPGVAVWVRGEELGVKFSRDPAETAEALIGLATYG